MTVQRALVTGGTGFVGANLLKRLLDEGWQVHVIIRQNSDLSLITEQKDRLVLHVHDGTMESMLDIVASASPDVVFHLASLFLTEHKSEDIHKLLQSNISYGIQLVEAMVKANIQLLVNTGTNWQHFEDKAYSPVNLYAATKHAFEGLLQYYVESRGLRVITLKLSDTYGPDDPRPKLVNLFKHLAENEQVAMSPGQQYIDLVYIEDVVRAFLVASKRLLEDKSIDHERYSVSSGQPTQLRELVQHVERILGRQLAIEWGGRPYRAREVMQPWVGEVLPGWEATIDLNEGLRRVL